VYQGTGGGTPQEAADNAVRLVEKYGYTALKMGPHPRGDRQWHDMGIPAWLKGVEAKMAAVREAVGDDVDIGLDSHAQIFEPAKALAMCNVLEPYRPLFVEEPLRAENRAALGHLRSKSPVPIATGEGLYTKFEFRDLLFHQAADILQPDVCLMGGLWEMKKIAAMAEAEYAMMAPHNPCGPVANAVNLHFAMSTQNFLVLEYRPDDHPDRRALVDEPMVLEDGYLIPPTRPGLGLDLNLEACSKHVYKAWHRPFLWRIDGSFGYQ
jgi:galactonate dehydratase